MKIDLTKSFDLVNLPSEGHFYSHKKGSVFVKFLTSHEEKVLTSPFLVENGMALNMVLSNCILDEEINAGDLIIGDVQAISMFLRSTAYGDKIQLDIECPECGREIHPSFYISKMKAREMKFNPDKDGKLCCEIGHNSFKIKVPTLKEEIDFNLKNDETLMGRLSFVIEEMNGETNSGRIKRMLPNMKPLESRLLREFIEENTPGVDPVIDICCDFCQADFKSKFNVGFNFISLPQNYYQNILEELFLLQYYGKGITLQQAQEIPVHERRWYINRISEELEKKRKAEEKAYSAAKRSSKR